MGHFLFVNVEAVKPLMILTGHSSWTSALYYQCRKLKSNIFIPNLTKICSTVPEGIYNIVNRMRHLMALLRRHYLVSQLFYKSGSLHTMFIDGSKVVYVVTHQTFTSRLDLLNMVLRFDVLLGLRWFSSFFIWFGWRRRSIWKFVYAARSALDLECFLFLYFKVQVVGNKRYTWCRKWVFGF